MKVPDVFSKMDQSNLSDVNKRKLQRMTNKLAKYKAFVELTKSHERGHSKVSPSVKSSSREEGSPDSGVDIVDAAPTYRPLPAEELEHLRARLRAQQKDKLSRPLLFQTNVPHLIQCADVRQLLMYALEGGNAPGLKPSWCTLVRWQKISQLVVVSVENMTVEHFNTFTETDPSLRLFLDTHGPLAAQEPGELARNLLEYPLSVRTLTGMSSAKKQKLVSDGSVTVAYNSNFIIPRALGAVTDFSSQISRLHLLLSVERMALEKYPVPTFSREMDIGHFVPTQEAYESVTERSPIFAIDCEMCMTSIQKSELTRISIVNENLEVIYDTYVKPYNPVTNYLTRFSGITKAILDPVKTRLSHVQDAIRKLLPADAILCGQSLNGDLLALEMTHPYVIDTSVVYNLKGNPRAKTSLKNLSQIFLSKSIQESDKKGHDSVEDSRTTMELVLLKLKHGHAFGDVTRGWQFSQLDDLHTADVKTVSGVTTDQDFLPLSEAEQPIPVVEFPQKRKNIEDSVAVSRDVPLATCLYTQSLLECCRRTDKRACFVGCSTYVEELSSIRSEVHFCSDSKESLETATEKVNDFDVVYCDVKRDTATLQTSDDTAKQQKNSVILMRRISRIFASVPDRSLCVLVLGGSRTLEREKNGICCAGIKTLATSLGSRNSAEPASDPD